MTKMFDRLSVRLTAAFLLAAVMGVALVALLVNKYISSDFSAFTRRMESMWQMMGGDMMGGTISFAQEAADFSKNLEQTLWIAGLFGAALAIVLGYLFTRQIVAPLDRVTTAARRVAEGDLTQRVKTSGSGELAELGKSFNQMATTLSRDQRLRQNMIADIAHELRTPLSILQGNVEAMLDGVLDTNTENLNSLHQETKLLSRLIDDLRTLSLAEAGQLKFYPEAIDMREVSSQVIDGFQTQFATKNLKVSLEATEDMPLAWVDSDRTAQVIRNLVSNAFNYTPEGGSITLRLTPGREGITVSVIDTGTGIPADDLPHVFNRLYRVDRSRTRSTGGSGLGLAIVKQLVEDQGGRVWVESQPGQGATFSFLVPYPSE